MEEHGQKPSGLASPYTTPQSGREQGERAMFALLMLQRPIPYLLRPSRGLDFQ